MKIQQTTCDVCGIEKKITNHWLYAYESNPNPEVVGEFNTFLISREPIAARSELKDVCGQECATKLLQHWMATGCLETPATMRMVTL